MRALAEIEKEVFELPWEEQEKLVNRIFSQIRPDNLSSPLQIEKVTDQRVAEYKENPSICLSLEEFQDSVGLPRLDV